jgi:hypothetical protein
VGVAKTVRAWVAMVGQRARQGVSVLWARCHAHWCAAQGWCVRACMGMWGALWARWAARSRRGGMATMRRRVGPRRRRPVELITRVEAR